MARCTAKAKQTQEQCKNAPMQGRTVCRLHGGKIPTGFGLPQTRHGRYSRHLSLQLAAHYQEALADGDLHSIRDEVGVLEARVRALLDRTHTSDLGHAWVDLDRAWRDFLAARTAGNIQAMGEALADVETQVNRGKADYALWADITSKLKDLAALRLSEHKRLMDLQAVITEERALTIFGLIQQTFREVIFQHVEETQALTILQATQQALRVYDSQLQRFEYAHPRT